MEDVREDGMAKKKRDDEHENGAGVATAPPPDGAPPRMENKPYLRELRRLHGELVALQEWVKRSGTKVCVVLEGRDTAGKGGTIKAITERVSLPAGGEVVVFDRSWYNRAGVERVLGFTSEDEVGRFLEAVPGVEQAMVRSGIILLKYWLEVGPQEQTRRLESRINDPRKIWKLSDLDLKSYTRWNEYSGARDEMFRTTDTPWAPWHVVPSDDKKRARLNLITHLLDQVPYEPLEPRKVSLPKRRVSPDIVGPRAGDRRIPTPF
jgi:polyphosphate kinase 2 (PPK2 family)